MLKIDKTCKIELEKNSSGEELFQIFNDDMDDFSGNEANDDLSFNGNDNGYGDDYEYGFDSFDEDDEFNDEF